MGTPSLRSKFAPLNLFKGGRKRLRVKRMGENVTPI